MYIARVMIDGDAPGLPELRQCSPHDDLLVSGQQLSHLLLERGSVGVDDDALRDEPRVLLGTHLLLHLTLASRRRRL